MEHNLGICGTSSSTLSQGFNPLLLLPRTCIADMVIIGLENGLAPHSLQAVI